MAQYWKNWINEVKIIKAIVNVRSLTINAKKRSVLSLHSGKTVDEHKEVITITTPVWVDNDEYFLLELSMPSGAGNHTFHMLDAVANFTLRG